MQGDEGEGRGVGRKAYEYLWRLIIFGMCRAMISATSTAGIQELAQEVGRYACLSQKEKDEGRNQLTTISKIPMYVSLGTGEREFVNLRAHQRMSPATLALGGLSRNCCLAG